MEQFLRQPVKLIHWLWGPLHSCLHCHMGEGGLSWITWFSACFKVSFTMFLETYMCPCLVKNLIFFLKRFPSFTSWDLSGGPHKPSSDLNEAKVGQWPALSTFCKMTKTWVITPIGDIECWKWRRRRKQVVCHIHGFEHFTPGSVRKVSSSESCNKCEFLLPTS